VQPQFTSQGRFFVTSPGRKTIKKLFAVSGNRCAFPKCEIPLIDNLSGKVTGKICHIRAKSPGGPRYDPSQSDEERDAFENLLLMCPIHHDVIDADPESYTVSRLGEIKAKHETLYAGGNEPSDDDARQFLLNITSSTISHGSLIFSNHQMGGQVAHSIVNIGQQPRQISQASANVLISELRKYPSENFEISSLMNDVETYNLAQVLEAILKHAGWSSSSGISQSIFSGLPRGVIIETPVEKLSLKILLNWLGQIGLNPQGFLKPNSTLTRIIVGTAM